MTVTVLNAPAASASSASASAVPLRGALASGHLPVGTSVMYPSFGQTMTTSGTSRIKHRLSADASGIRLHYYNGSANAIRVAASVDSTEYSGGTCPATFGGLRLKTIDPLGYVISDPVDVLVTGATGFFSRTYVEFDAGGNATLNVQPTQTGEGQNYSTGTDVTASGSVPQDFNLRAFGPVALTAIPGTTPIPPVVGFVGDSIMVGSGDTNQAGFGLRAFNAAPFQTGKPLAGVQMVAIGGEGAVEIPLRTYRPRMPLLSGCTHIISNYGINDIRGSSFTLAQIQATWLSGWKQLSRRGAKVFQTTVLPTEAGGALTGGQETVRTGANDWLRAGAPIDPTTKAAVAIGTSGALVTGNVGHWLTDYIETADVIETSRNSGLVTAGMLTDGTHPTPTGHIALAAAIPLAKFGL